MKTSYEPGEEIMYNCDPGYVSRLGSRRFTCPLTGVWPINTLKCIRKSAPSLIFSPLFWVPNILRGVHFNVRTLSCLGCRGLGWAEQQRTVERQGALEVLPGRSEWGQWVYLEKRRPELREIEQGDLDWSKEREIIQVLELNNIRLKKNV